MPPPRPVYQSPLTPAMGILGPSEPVNPPWSTLTPAWSDLQPAGHITMSNVDLTITPPTGSPLTVGNLPVLGAIDLVGYLDWQGPTAPPAWDMLDAANSGKELQFKFGPFALKQVKTAGKDTVPAVDWTITDSASGTVLSWDSASAFAVIDTLGYLAWASDLAPPALPILHAAIGKTEFKTTFGTYLVDVKAPSSKDPVEALAEADATPDAEAA